MHIKRIARSHASMASSVVNSPRMAKSVLSKFVLPGADLGIVRRGLFVVQTSHCIIIKGGGAAFLLSMLTGNGSFVCAKCC